MYFTYNGQELAFRFKHNTFLPITEQDTPMGTECLVTDKEGNFVAKSFSRVHPKDSFDKEKGRQIAFGRALAQFVEKADRLAFWQAYSNWRTSEPRMILGTKRQRKAKLKIV